MIIIINSDNHNTIVSKNDVAFVVQDLLESSKCRNDIRGTTLLAYIQANKQLLNSYRGVVQDMQENVDRCIDIFNNIVVDTSLTDSQKIDKVRKELFWLQEATDINESALCPKTYLDVVSTVNETLHL